MTPPETAVRERLSADERRDAIVAAAIEEFADNGFEGASTEAIARRVGISQPYIFRLFGTKRDLFIATIERCFEETRQQMLDAGRGLRGTAVLDAIGKSYIDLITNHPTKLRAQLQAYAACSDPAIRAVVSRNFGSLVETIETLSGESPTVVATFFAQGMLLNVLATAGVLGTDEPWAARLTQGCLTMCDDAPAC